MTEVYLPEEVSLSKIHGPNGEALPVKTDAEGNQYVDAGDHADELRDQWDILDPETGPDDWDPPAIVKDLRGRHWNDVVTVVKVGEYDEHLDALERYDDRDTVQSAIEDRRNILEDNNG